MKPWPRLAAVTAAALLLAACGQKEPIRIGLIGELTGPQADLAEAARNGTMLAIEREKSSGGLQGRPIELLVRDTGASPEAARKNVAELIDAKVVAIIGPMSSATAEVVKPLADAAKVVLISPTITAAQFADQDD